MPKQAGNINSNSLNQLNFVLCSKIAISDTVVKIASQALIQVSSSKMADWKYNKDVTIIAVETKSNQNRRRACPTARQALQHNENKQNVKKYSENGCSSGA